MSFLPESVYGNRSGFQEVLLVTSSDKVNAPVKSKFFKTGQVSGVSMLPRSDMVKLPRDSYGTEGRFTRVQELKQARVCSKLCYDSIPCFKIIFWYHCFNIVQLGAHF